jgi:hypothetical protein
VEREDDQEAYLISSPVASFRPRMAIYYSISSPDIHIQLLLVSASDHEILESHLLLPDVETFEYSNDDVGPGYVMIFHVVRVCAARCSTNGYVELRNVRTEEILPRGRFYLTTVTILVCVLVRHQGDACL